MGPYFAKHHLEAISLRLVYFTGDTRHPEGMRYSGVIYSQLPIYLKNPAAVYFSYVIYCTSIGMKIGDIYPGIS